MAALAPGALVLSAGSLPRVSFRDRVRAAVAGGFAGLSLWLRHDDPPDADRRAMLADAGLAVAELEALSDVLDDPATVARPGAREVVAHRIATALGARSLGVVHGAGPPLDVARAGDAFGAICDRAAAVGLLAHVEFWPGSRADLATATAIVRRAARPNGGLLVDSWHLARTGVELDAVDAPVVAVQLSDGPLAGAGDYLDETMHRRRIPGEGEFDLVGLVRALDARGVTAPFAVEVLSDALAELPPIEVGRRLGAATRAVLARAREGR